MEPNARRLEEMYAYPTSKQPWIRTNFVSTLDGAAQASNGRSGPLGNSADKQVFALLRSLADIIVVGAGTARIEGYAPVRPDEVDTDLRQRLGLTPTPPVAVVSATLNIPIALIARGQIVITTEDAPAARAEALREHVDVIAAGKGAIDWHQVLGELTKRQLTRILCEGGPTLHASLIEHDLVDDICLTIAPTLAAGEAFRISRGDRPVDRAMALAHAIPVDDFLLTRYTRARH